MKKLGFTLSELIVALSIIGVVSAATVPVISGTMPDKNKVKVLKVYKLVNDINKDMLSNIGLYMPDGDGNCIGLACMQQPTDPQFNRDVNRGVQKYPRLLASHLELMENPQLGQVTIFNTVDGVRWVIRPEAPGDVAKLYTISVDFDSENESNCDFSTCDNPDTFVFNVGRNGVLTGEDPLTRAYLLNPHKLNDKRKDYAKAEELR